MIAVRVGPFVLACQVRDVFRHEAEGPAPCTCDRCHATIGPGDVSAAVNPVGEVLLTISCPGCRVELGRMLCGFTPDDAHDLRELRAERRSRV